AEKDFLAVVAVGDHTEFVAHAPFGDHPARNAGGHFYVARVIAGDVIGAEDDLLGGAAAHRHHQLVDQFGAAGRVAITFGQAHHHAERAAARDDGGLVDRVAVGAVDRAERVAGLVVGGHLL